MPPACNWRWASTCTLMLACQHTCSCAPPQPPCITSDMGQPTAELLKPSAWQAVCRAALARSFISQAARHRSKHAHSPAVSWICVLLCPACTLPCTKGSAGMFCSNMVSVYLMCMPLKPLQPTASTCKYHMQIDMAKHAHLSVVQLDIGTQALCCRALQACCMTPHSPPARADIPVA